jgi:hypothetical protein
LTRRLRWALATFGLALGLAACSSGGAKKPPSDCQWPTGSVDALAIVTVGDSRGYRLEAYRPTDGARVGSCGLRVVPAAQPKITVGKDEFGARGYAFRVPLVAGADLRVVPDNPPEAGGGVRDLRTGTRHSLSFAGWQVVSAVGDKLLLQADQVNGVDQRNAADWCVLPSVRARKSQCAAVPGATGRGIATVSPTGRISWVPDTGQKLRIGGISGQVSTDGRGAVLAFGAGTLLAGRPAALLAPAALDQRTLVFVPNSATPHPAGGQTLQWARVRPGPGGLQATVHDARVATLPGTGNPFDLTEIHGIAASPDGTRLVVLLQDHSVYEFADGGPARKLVTLQTGIQPALVDLVSWPFTGPAASTT